MNNLIGKEAQQTHLSQEFIIEEDQSLLGMLLLSEEIKMFLSENSFSTGTCDLVGSKKKNAIVEITHLFSPCFVRRHRLDATSHLKMKTIR